LKSIIELENNVGIVVEWPYHNNRTLSKVVERNWRILFGIVFVASPRMCEHIYYVYLLRYKEK
jgi:hypothetical protein